MLRSLCRTRSNSVLKYAAAQRRQQSLNNLVIKTPVVLAQAANMTTDHTALIKEVKQLIPELTASKYKGQAGKVAVIGGCREYTGAPFFAAYSALKVGADLSHVFCTPGAATVIKCYSPELIVHPYLPASNEAALSSDHQDASTTQATEAAVDEVSKWLDRFDVVVVGPGLGRDAVILSCVAEIIKTARVKNIPLVIDADGLWLINQQPELIQGYSNAILTPNIAEFRRLADTLHIDTDNATDTLERVCEELRGPIIVQKGPSDIICNAQGQRLVCDEPGSLRRAGGQGDVLSGCIAVFTAWMARSGSDNLMTAAYGGCLVTRLASRQAFIHHGRAMGATDIIAELGKVVDSI